MGNFTRELDGTLQGVAASVRAEAGEHLAGAEGRRTVQKCCFSLSVEISHVFYQKKKKKITEYRKTKRTASALQPAHPSTRGPRRVSPGLGTPMGRPSGPCPGKGAAFGKPSSRAGVEVNNSREKDHFPRFNTFLLFL